MKKLLAVVFMAVLSVAAFADITVQTITPTVYHDGSCERAGTVKFVLDNTIDYQQISTTNYILVRIELTDGAVLCHDLDLTDDGTSNWVNLEVDGTQWQAGDIQARGLKGENVVYIKICDAPAGAPSPATPGWFILGNTTSVGGSGGFTANALCVDYSAHPGNVDQFPANEFNQISISDYLVDLTVTGEASCAVSVATTGAFLGTSYDPADPSIAYGGPANPLELTVNSTCGKSGSDLDTADVYLCECVTFTTPDQVDIYECEDTYRYGTLDLNSASCSVFLEEDEIGMLTAGSTLTMTVVDAAGNPLSTINNGVYFSDSKAPTLAANTLTSGLAITGATAGVVHDANNAGEWSLANAPTEMNDGVCDDSDQACADLANMIESYTWTVNTASSLDVGTLTLSDLDLGRLVSDGPITAYIKVAWAPYPCGAGGETILIDYPINFVDCATPATHVPVYYNEYAYYPYFPGATYKDGEGVDQISGWWTGVVVTNVTYFYENMLSRGMDQSLALTLYFIEEDGDVYTYDAGTLGMSSIYTLLVTTEDGSTLVVPTLETGYTDATFGDERYWVIAKATGTEDGKRFAIDGFYMMGTGAQAQGGPARVNLDNATGTQQQYN